MLQGQVLRELPSAKPFNRPPNNDVHPDLFTTKNGMIVAGRFVRRVANSDRVPDVDSADWFAQGSLRERWKENWNKTGDSLRHESHGIAPPGWVSRAQPEPYALFKAKAPLPASPAAVKYEVDYRGGKSRLATWTRYDYRAPGLRLTNDPSRRHDGKLDQGPQWSKVVRRMTYDMYNGDLLEDINTKGVSLEKASGPIPFTTRGLRDIVTVFFFRPGKWKPEPIDNEPLIDINDVPAMPVVSTTKANSTGGEQPTRPVERTATKDDWIPMKVRRLQAAMGAPVSDVNDIRDARNHTATDGLPKLPPGLAAALTQHRPKVSDTPLLFNACVARPVSRKERNETPAALEAVKKEWTRLRNVKHKHGVGVWDESRVREKYLVRQEAKRNGTTVHFARIFDLCVMKGSELPDGHPDKKYKGRAVLQGDQVKDQNWEAALFQDLSSSPAAMEASRAADAYGMCDGNDIEVADADQAYTELPGQPL